MWDAAQIIFAVVVALILTYGSIAILFAVVGWAWRRLRAK
jgi:hypothetical protein